MSPIHCAVFSGAITARSQHTESRPQLFDLLGYKGKEAIAVMGESRRMAGSSREEPVFLRLEFKVRALRL